ncbi:hypothetical protein BLA29_012797 [Euroglyphus maynei]|uniref:Uncharacterized protein n=1 Tax=Euroglyphus maynei TaxID=6958 RepID=A0A1Y3BII2_EURMA|nr:hypothetical protein BLA29_012797 [Euroglyphus maynei]
MNPNQVNSNMMIGPGNIPPTQISNTASPHQILPNPTANHPSQPPPPPPPQQTSSHQISNTHHDLNRLKNLISMLRETLRNFFIISGMNIDYSTQMDNL